MVHGRHHPAMATNPQGRPAFGYSTPDQVYPISDSTRIWPSQNTGSSTNSPLTDHRRTPPGLSDCQSSLTHATDRVEVETVINGFSSSYCCCSVARRSSTQVATGSRCGRLGWLPNPQGNVSGFYLLHSVALPFPTFIVRGRLGNACPNRLICRL